MKTVFLAICVIVTMVKCCPDLPNPEFGLVLRVGDKTYYGCKYDLKLRETRECIDGQWTGEALVCPPSPLARMLAQSAAAKTVKSMSADDMELAITVLQAMVNKESNKKALIEEGVPIWSTDKGKTIDLSALSKINQNARDQHDMTIEQALAKLLSSKLSDKEAVEQNCCNKPPYLSYCCPFGLGGGKR